MLIWKLNRADERLAFAHAVAIGTAGHEQIVLVGNFKIMFGDSRGVFGVKAFDAVESGRNHTWNHFVAMTQAGMGHHGDAARVMNQINRVRRGHFEFWHPGRPILLQEPFECFIEAAAKAGFDQCARHMRPAR